MSQSPIEQFLAQIDAGDYQGLIGLFAPQVSLTTVFGDEYGERADVELHCRRFLGELRATRHEITSGWNPEPGTWIAELTASYELSDRRRLGPYRRVIVLRAGDAGIEQVHVYGEHEPALSAAGRPYAEVRGPHGWLPTL